MKLPDWLNSTLASDAAAGKGVLNPEITTLRIGAKIAGPAHVVLVPRDDNKGVRDVLAAPPEPGHVLVVSGARGSRNAVIGGLIAYELDLIGFRGMVTDGPIRDAEEIRAMPLGVWCTGTTPLAGIPSGPAKVGGEVVIGGVLVRSGDIVIADDDGVVVWPAEQRDDLLAKAKARLDSDNDRLNALKARRPSARA